MNRKNIEENIGDIITHPNKMRESYVKKNYPELHEIVVNFIDLDISFKEKMWYCVNDIKKEHLCKCGNKTTFNKKFTEGYKKYCSAKCTQSDSNTKAKRERTVLEKYGTTNVAKNKDVQKKKEDTNMERYGHKSSFQNEEVQEKRKNNNRAKYGVDHTSHLDSVREKIKNTMTDLHKKDKK